MSYIEAFITKNIDKLPNQIGYFQTGEVELGTLISTRPFLTQDRMSLTTNNSKKRRGAPTTPQIIECDGRQFIIDGHHKARKESDKGNQNIVARIFFTDYPPLINRLERMAHGPINGVPIISK